MINRNAFLHLLVVGIPLLAAGCSRSGDEKTSYAIKDIRAFPYYTATGAVRRDLNLFDEKLLLWNVIIGGGDCGEECLPEIPGKTTATMIEVQLISTSKPDWKSPIYVELRARSFKGQRSIKTERIRLNGVLVSESKTWFVPFMLYGTGCEELEISAHLIYGKKAVNPPLTKIIPFKCGE